MFLFTFREELRGIKRKNNAKDVDWSKVANTIDFEVTTKPPPEKISVQELISKVKGNKVSQPTALQTIVVNKKGSICSVIDNCQHALNNYL